MGRQRLGIGTYGDIHFRTASSGRVCARCRYQDWDGKNRMVQATGTSRASAEQALKSRLRERTLFSPGTAPLTMESSFPELVTYWLADLDLEDSLSKTTRQLYQRNMETLVLPAFQDLVLREVGVARCDHLLKSLAKRSYNRAKQARVVLRLCLGLAVRHEIIPRNPMDGVSRLHKPPHTPTALTAAEVNAVRAAIVVWEQGLSVSGPKPDGQLGAIIEVMLDSSARIGEVLAIRRKDVDITAAIPTLRICGTVVQHRGESPARQDHPKTAKSRRTVALPSFATEAIRLRMARMNSRASEALLFSTRDGTPLTTCNVRRQLRAALKAAGIEGVTPHMFRRTVATAINESEGIDLAAELLGHTDPKITIQHYIRRNEMVNPVTADILERAFTKR